MIDVTPLGNLIFISSAVSTGILKNTQANRPYWTQGHLVVHIYFISVDTFYEIGLDFHAISRKNVNIRKLKSKAEPKTK